MGFGLRFVVVSHRSKTVNYKPYVRSYRFFWLRHPESQDDHKALRAGIESLKEVKELTAAYIGTPAETRRPVIDHSYDFSITFVFADKAAHDTYQSHPIHLKFVDECAHLWERVQVYDAVS